MSPWMHCTLTSGQSTSRHYIDIWDLCLHPICHTHGELQEHREWPKLTSFRNCGGSYLLYEYVLPRRLVCYWGGWGREWGTEFPAVRELRACLMGQIKVISVYGSATHTGVFWWISVASSLFSQLFGKCHSLNWLFEDLAVCMGRDAAPTPRFPSWWKYSDISPILLSICYILSSVPGSRDADGISALEFKPLCRVQSDPWKRAYVCVGISALWKYSLPSCPRVTSVIACASRWWCQASCTWTFSFNIWGTRH